MAMTDFIIIVVNYFIIIEVKAGGELERSLVEAMAVELREAYLGTLERPLAKISQMLRLSIWREF